MSAAHRRQAALDDLLDHFMFLAENVDVDTAERFLVNAEAAFEGLALQPLIGSPLSLKHPDLAGMRRWRIKGFDNHLIFYLPRPDGVSVVRVLHASRDWWRLLDVASEAE
jgi:toxin ParE1/3/4